MEGVGRGAFGLFRLSRDGQKKRRKCCEEDKTANDVCGGTSGFLPPWEMLVLRAIAPLVHSHNRNVW